MSGPWKTLLISVAIFQVALTIAFWRMTDYVQWLHFNDTVVAYDGFMDTAPGRKVGTLLIFVGVSLVIVNIVAAASRNRGSGSPPDSRRR